MSSATFSSELFQPQWKKQAAAFDWWPVLCSRDPLWTAQASVQHPKKGSESILPVRLSMRCTEVNPLRVSQCFPIYTSDASDRKHFRSKSAEDNVVCLSQIWTRRKNKLWSLVFKGLQSTEMVWMKREPVWQLDHSHMWTHHSPGFPNKLVLFIPPSFFVLFF